MKHISSARILRPDLVRYFAVSLLALILDLATLSACLRLLHLDLAVSASLGFAVGAVAAYLLSIYWVFNARTMADMPALEFVTFVAIGLAGLGVTQIVLWVGVQWLGLIPEMVKLVAAGITFTFNYLLRKSILFAAGARAVHARRTVA